MTDETTQAAAPVAPKRGRKPAIKAAAPEERKDYGTSDHPMTKAEADAEPKTSGSVTGKLSAQPPVDNAHVADGAEPFSPKATKSLTAPVAGQACYYVWNEKTESVASFHEDQYKGEAFKFAKELADQHEGWTIT